MSLLSKVSSLFSVRYDYVDPSQIFREMQVSQLYPNERPSNDRMQNERREFKYVIPYNGQATVSNIRRFISCHLAPDEFTTIALVKQLARIKGQPIPMLKRLTAEEKQHYALEIKHNPDYNLILPPARGYLVHSIYLDDFSKITVKQTLEGMKNRFKIRIRFYDDETDGLASLEVKERRNQIILKSRAFVPKKIAEKYLNNDDFTIEDNHLISNTYKEREGLYNFLLHCRNLGAQPSRYTSYYREGYENLDNNEVRVTFDRDVRGADYQKRLDASHRANWPLVDFGGTILELKFCESPPWWMSDLCQQYNLERGSAAKYVGSVTIPNSNLQIGNFFYAPEAHLSISQHNSISEEILENYEEKEDE